MSLHLTLGFLGVFGSAIDFIFHQQEARTGQVLVGGPDQVLHLTGQHLKVTFLALGLATAIGLPTGVVLGHLRKGEGFAILLGNAGRAVPELALIAFVAAFIGVGLLNVTFAFAVLGIPPILTNAYVGVSQVDRDAVEAARGMGMSALQVIRRVELPLAVPTIMAGVRTGAVNIIATVALASLAGVSTLGDLILGRNVYGDQGVVAGAILIALLTLTLELSLAGLQWLLTPRGLRVARTAEAA
ncbi:MAG: osmoprotectant transport system substrate-binding protein opuBD [Solirubrobacterales bacterium]|nr:osmoprotectant transport system substrate-binding protein opuBD [Solirubrobacterales bacterium]